ncbi:hypothetical protein BJ508DRAFT_326811 [Ascobolus immersus RN42]|uniref:F-box domain-containing protein n=1 Tax=Ascobolus immersus RN42 TaxID=1160509 RepID=A0A3N4I4E4_ASCIM|nr:hypothetical protein BJ508DRAFT_326811 [Ascobolus immersus RN42]
MAVVIELGLFTFPLALVFAVYLATHLLLYCFWLALAIKQRLDTAFVCLFRSLFQPHVVFLSFQERIQSVSELILNASKRPSTLQARAAKAVSTQTCGPLVHDASTQTMSFPPYFRGFTGLPLELRLEIYEKCTAFSLLQLAQTSPYLRNEILSRPSLYSFSNGYDRAKRPEAECVSKWVRCSYSNPPRFYGVYTAADGSAKAHVFTVREIHSIPDRADQMLAEDLLRREHIPGRITTCWFLCGAFGNEGCGRLLWKGRYMIHPGFPRDNCLDCEQPGSRMRPLLGNGRSDGR